MRSHRSIKPKDLVQLTLLVAGVVFAADAHAGNFNQHLMRLAQYSVQMRMSEREIEELIEKKRHAHSQRELHEIVAQLSAKHRELSEASKDYEKLRQHIRFEHPEKNETVERQYTRREVKSLAELENEFGIDGRLDRIKARVMTTFPVPERPKPQISPIFTSLRKPAAIEGEDDPDQPEEILLKK